MGWRYDAHSDGVLTHTKAINEHAHLTLSAAVDPCAQTRTEFNQAYPDVNTYASIAEAAQKNRFDWIFLALPTGLHFAAFNEVLNLKPQVIVCEKPLAPTLSEADAMVARAAELGCLLLVNYIRPHEPFCKNMFTFIREKTWGDVQKIIVRYGKGVANSASHFIQLLVQEFGVPTRIRILSPNNLNLADPEPDFVLEFGDINAIFLRFDYQCYALSELDFYLQQGAVFYRAMGQLIEYQQALPDQTFPTVKRLQQVRIESTQLINYQRHALAAYYLLWQGNKNNHGFTDSALGSLAVIEEIRAQLLALDAHNVN
jgi:predicted dehydrogenase